MKTEYQELVLKYMAYRLALSKEREARKDECEPALAYDYDLEYAHEKIHDVLDFEESTQIEELEADLAEVLYSSDEFNIHMRNMHIEPTKILFEARAKRYLSSLAYLRGPKMPYWTKAKIAALRGFCWKALGYEIVGDAMMKRAEELNKAEAEEVYNYIS